MTSPDTPSPKEHPLSVSLEESARASKQERDAKLAAGIGHVPEGVIPPIETVEVPQSMQPATGIKGALVNGHRSRKAGAYQRGFVEGRTHAAIVDPSKLVEMQAEGLTGSSVHQARVEGHVTGYNTLPRQDQR